MPEAAPAAHAFPAANPMVGGPAAPMMPGQPAAHEPSLAGPTGMPVAYYRRSKTGQIIFLSILVILCVVLIPALIWVLLRQHTPPEPENIENESQTVLRIDRRPDVVGNGFILGDGRRRA